MKKKILIFCDYYLPGYKSGGGMWTVVNLVERFADRYDFSIVTRNHDGRSDRTPFTSVKTDEWNDVGPAKVFYLSSNKLKPAFFAEIVKVVAPDAVFLNSALSKPVRTFLTARRKGLVGNTPVILAPCGEMSAGALSLKPVKKKLFFQYAKTVKLYDGVIWKASFESEGDEIRKVFGDDVKVMNAPDLAPKVILSDYDQAWKPAKEPGSVRFAFISRLSRKKNIHYFLERLLDINSGKIHFDMIGPMEDEGYRVQCEEIISRLPANITVEMTGAFPSQNDALRRLAESHFFAMPTLNENFGYVFVESLAAGLPLLISENTVWKDIDEKNAGWQTRLDQPEAWVALIRRCVDMDKSEYSVMSTDARNYALNWLADPKIEQATAEVLEFATSTSRSRSTSK